uniref:Uncharacterized protein n=1 Tax=Candidatus Kentrum sp. FW TaxID=2126338 RepID=A0A450TJE4_9GAMM|nr:MAG: hypothetical protein BECKFW1821C_GA0114237_101218 [Candidatus Kentron sp. FW]
MMGTAPEAIARYFKRITRRLCPSYLLYQFAFAYALLRTGSGLSFFHNDPYRATLFGFREVT